MTTRNEARAERIVASAERIQDRLKTNLPADKRKALEAKLGEYERSLRNLKAGHRETSGTGNAGVKIDVPEKLFSVKGN